MGELDGRVVLVTGGNGGIGLGMAEACARAGADVAIWGTRKEKNEAAAARLRETGREVAAFRCDVSDQGQVVDTFAATVDRLGKVDALFANAGMGWAAPFVDQTLEQWRRVLAVNLEGVFLCFREAARHMIERGEGGSLVAVSSVAAIHGAPRNQPYAASKGAVNAVVRGLAVELGRYRIRCNSILPGWIETEMTEAARQNEKVVQNTTYRTPLRRWGTPADFGGVAVYLANPAHEFHTGDCLVVDGGYSIF